MDLKDSLTLAGVVAGYLSFFRLLFGDLLNWGKGPRLAIEFDPVEDIRQWSLIGGWGAVGADQIPRDRIQRVATVHVRNKRKTPALRCVAVLRVISAPPGVVIEKEFVLHWADTDYTGHSNFAEPIEIGLERRRLDVAFTIRHEGQSPEIRGAWVAIPLALSDPARASQAYLHEGEYRFKLSVECANGKGASKDFLVKSPGAWTDLSMRPASKGLRKSLGALLSRLCKSPECLMVFGCLPRPCTTAPSLFRWRATVRQSS